MTDRLLSADINDSSPPRWQLPWIIRIRRAANFAGSSSRPSRRVTGISPLAHEIWDSGSSPWPTGHRSYDRCDPPHQPHQVSSVTVT